MSFLVSEAIHIRPVESMSIVAVSTLECSATSTGPGRSDQKP